jgi:hypothetical protein
MALHPFGQPDGGRISETREYPLVFGSNETEQGKICQRSIVAFGLGSLSAAVKDGKAEHPFRRCRSSVPTVRLLTLRPDDYLLSDSLRPRRGVIRDKWA